MATEVLTEGVVGRTPGLTTPRPHISWGAVFAGAVAALGLWILLYALGMALGLSTVDTNDPSSLRSSGIFTGVFGLVAPLIALFVGGMVAGRSAGVLEKASGVVHGLVMWGMTTVLGAYLAMNLVGTLVGGAASAGKSVVEGTASAISGAAEKSGGLPAALGLDAEAALKPVNQRLAEAGKPAVTAAQLEATMRDVVQSAAGQGRLDREQLVQSVATNTKLSRTDAEEVAAQLEAQVQQARSRVGAQVDNAAQTVQAGALKAADATGKAFWGVFGALLLGLISALVGARIGVARGEKAAETVLAREQDRSTRVLREQPGHS